MDTQHVLSRMNNQAQIVGALVADCSDHQARWRPDAGCWSVLEVVNHLLDEEREDFRVFIDLILDGRGVAHSIDPQGWVTERAYNQRDLAQSIQSFLTARQESLDWLKDLVSPDWEKEYEAPFGRIRAGDVLAAWVAHDVLHIRQLVELRWAYLTIEVEPYSVRYAGEW